MPLRAWLGLETLEPRLLLSLDLYVSQTGSDANPGTLDLPFASIGKARQVIRNLNAASALPEGGVTVNLRGGVYLRTASFDLYANDSGAPGKPITWRACNGETVRFVGGVALQPSWFTPVTSSSAVWGRLKDEAKGNLYEVDLPAHGITNFGTLQKRAGWTWNAPSAMELFYNAQPMQLGRYPNEGFLQAGTVVAPGSFTYSDPAVERWMTAEDPWFSGLFGTYWYHSQVGGTIDPVADTITLDADPQYGVKPGQPYSAFNLLEEIDSPGEWYLNRNTGMLYFWAPAALAGSEIFVSTVNDDMLHLKNASYITVEGITFEMSRASLVRIEGGAHNRLTHCVLRNAGRYGIDISGMDNGIERSEIYNIGESAVTLTGGDRPTLQPAGNYVRNCDIHDWARCVRSSKVALRVEGVGQIVAHNDIHDAPSGAIWYMGNEHVLEYNDIYGVCREIKDAGAIYTHRDWSYRGNVIRYNFIHDLQNVFASSDLYGIYLDDASSQAEVYGNLLYRIDGYATFNAGGRDNHWYNNMITQSYGGHLGDRRGVDIITDIPGDDCNFLEKLNTAAGGDFHSGVWAQEYPELASVPNDFAQLGDLKNPGGTTFAANWGWQNDTWMKEGRWGGLDGAFSWYASTADNVANQDPLFVDEAGGDFRLRSDSPVFAMIPSWQAIPIEWIGIQESDTPPPPPPPPLPPSNGATIVDNTSATFATTGQWTASTNVDAYAGGGLETTAPGARATWRPNLPQAGPYAVFLWIGARRSDGSNIDRDSAAVYAIQSADGMVTRIVDQDRQTGKWVFLGRYNFVPGTTGYVQLLCMGSDAGSTAADAVLFAPMVVTVDNTSSGFITTKLWNESAAVDSYQGSSITTMTIGATASWRPTLPLDGTYTVQAWWSANGEDGTIYNRDSAADYTIYGSTGARTVTVDQDKNSGRWVTLGVFEFSAGTSGYVTLVRDSDNGMSTVADAIRFVWMRTPL